MTTLWRTHPDYEDYDPSILGPLCWLYPAPFTQEEAEGQLKKGIVNEQQPISKIINHSVVLQESSFEHGYAEFGGFDVDIEINGTRYRWMMINKIYLELV